MKLRFYPFFGLIVGGLLLAACSTKKDAFINRNWHALNTKYNVMYNGNIAFEEGREELNAAYRDNYWEVLPVERLEVTEDIKLDSEDNNPKFVLAEEKASKAIQKHSMDIKDEERNPQTDEAFLLLGKARYFDQRYIPALEAFNYVLNKYTQSDKLNEATIWREKVHIRLENEELALKNLKRLFKYETLKDQEYADGRAMMAQAYINLQATDTAIQQLKIASAYTKKNPEKGRYYFIIGQLYDQLGHKDSANMAFDKIIGLNRKSPRVYLVNAHLNKIRNISPNPENKEALLEYLTELETDRENRPFLDKIYRQIAEYHLGYGSDSLALSYFNRSLRATQNEPMLNAMNYENLAEYHFDGSDYKTAGAYYDSTLTNLVVDGRKFREIKKKRVNLEDVITYEETVRHTDSIVQLYNMPKEERKSYFEAYIADMKKKEEEAQKKEKDKITEGFAAFVDSKGGKENKGKFYFYNITSLGYGKADFKNQWGNRTLEDNWRWANKNSAGQVDGETGIVAEAGIGTGEITQEQKYSVDFYVDRIPTDQSVIDSLVAERNFANYQLGIIYKEKFKENSLAAKKLNDVLGASPEERLVLPSKYNLYKIYEEMGSPLKEDVLADIIKNHPDSRYAEILLNPQAIAIEGSDTPDGRYGQLFQQYQNQEYARVIAGAEENINRYTGDEIVPKFEMLKANAIGRMEGFIAFKEALNYVALNYPNNPEGKKAQQMIEEQLPKLEPKEFSRETESVGVGNWKVVFPFKIQNNEEALKLIETLERSIKDLRYKISVSKDIYNLEEQFVVVHGFRSKDYALGYAELLKNNKEYRVAVGNFVILSSNYKIIQVHKNLNEYKEQLLTPKP